MELKMKPKVLHWGVIGTGRIAHTFAEGLKQSKTGKLVAIGSRSTLTAERFGSEFELSRRHGSYEDLLKDPEVEAVYISTPHISHAEWSIKAAEAGKHILCEKPLALNHAEAMATIEAARANNVFLMEALMYRCHPQTAKLVELLREKAIGEVRVIQATFSFHCSFNPESRLLNNALGGGGILDVGCYCTSMIRLIAGVALGGEFAEPLQVTGMGHIGPVSRVDEWTVAQFKFPQGIVAQLSTGVQVQQENVVRIFGSEGSLTISSPWIPASQGGTTHIILHRNGEAAPKDIALETGEWLYAIEADTVAHNLERHQASFPAMGWDDSLGNMKALDMWRDSIGLIYDIEKPEGQIRPVHGGPLSRKRGASMKYDQIHGLEKPVSRLIMGVDNQRTLAHASVMFDDFFERGGNCFDTAYVYAAGLMERLLGQWMTSRGVRKDVIVIGKGAHTPFCNPSDLSRQLQESLERLQTEYVDLYLMHRDNLEIPAGEFIEVLNEHRRAGRMRVFGVSNWSLNRVDEANRYAEARGLTGISVLSNNFSLARMVDPVWNGCVSVSDAVSREWLRKNRMPVLAWSSQARGFFTARAHPDERGDQDLVRCWYAQDNFRRQERARELARKRGVQPINVALAYVLCQPFPAFALIGPRVLSETVGSFAGLDVHLTPEELRWLNLED